MSVQKSLPVATEYSEIRAVVARFLSVSNDRAELYRNILDNCVIDLDVLSQVLKQEFQGYR